VAGGVEQQRCSAHCGIGIRVIEDQRSSANTRAEAAGAIGKQRVPTKACVSSSSRQEVKRITSFRCCVIGIAAIWRRTDCLRFWQKRHEPKRH
jgi:predicted RNA-binding Zn-ribbon protein involved in translation (DUF1610 family)